MFYKIFEMSNTEKTVLFNAKFVSQLFQKLENVW